MENGKPPTHKTSFFFQFKKFTGHTSHKYGANDSRYYGFVQVARVQK